MSNAEEVEMRARDIMTEAVVSVSPTASVTGAARSGL
jgi:hypothetical protein